MEITIKLTEKQMDDVMRAAETHTCGEWFEGNINEYEDWAGDIVKDTLQTFLYELYMNCGIEIITEG